MDLVSRPHRAFRDGGAPGGSWPYRHIFLRRARCPRALLAHALAYPSTGHWGSATHTTSTSVTTAFVLAPPKSPSGSSFAEPSGSPLTSRIPKRELRSTVGDYSRPGGATLTPNPLLLTRRSVPAEPQRGRVTTSPRTLSAILASVLIVRPSN